MSHSKDQPWTCPRCNEDVLADDDFCPLCGELFAENLRCKRHPETPAAGVCIIYAHPFCTRCGGVVNGHFLCSHHDRYEIYEGMARVFGTSDFLQAEFAKRSLEAAGLHPFIFSRKASPISVGAPEYTLYRASGDFDGHIVNEFKLMVPCQEVPAAEMSLKKLHHLR